MTLKNFTDAKKWRALVINSLWMNPSSLDVWTRQPKHPRHGTIGGHPMHMASTLNPHYQRQHHINKNLRPHQFAARVRQGSYDRGRTIRSGSVEKVIRAVGKAIDMEHAYKPILTWEGTLLPQLTPLFEGFNRQDPPPKK